MRESVKTHRLGLARKIVDYARNHRTAQSPGVLQEEVGFYVDPQLYDQEHRRFFRETPVVACLSKDLPRPSSYRPFDDLGVPILLWRGKDGAVRAFLNVCAHRGARLVREGCGEASRLSCPFHGWTFDATGAAVGIPLEAEFCDAIDGQKQLVSVPAEERHGLVFVQATPGSMMDLDAFLGGLGPELDLLEIGKATRSVEYELPATTNWKYALDAYFESYHVPVLHRDSFDWVIERNLLYFETWGPHHRITWAHNTIRDWMHKPESEWPVETAFPISYYIFPNTSIGVGSATHTGSMLSIQRVFPKSVGEVCTKATFCAPHYDEAPEHWAEVETSAASVVAGVRDEDNRVASESYRGLCALPAGRTFPIGRHEIGVQNFHENIRRLLPGDAA